MKVYVVQGNARDFGGEIDLIVTKENVALQECIDMTLKNNKDIPVVKELHKKLSDKEFYERVCCSAWVSGFTYDWFDVDPSD